MNSDVAFQIVCANCACLSIKIDEPLKSSREAIVVCGECGSPRGTVGALRDLAVQRHLDLAISTPDLALPKDEQTGDVRQPSLKISTQYAELRRLREQVKVAEWLASESRASGAGKAASAALHPSPGSERSLRGRRVWKISSLDYGNNQASKG